MATVAVHQIEKQFADLSREDQLIVLERLAHQFRMDSRNHHNGHADESRTFTEQSPLSTGGQRDVTRYSASGADLLSEAW